jgi:uncharacterized protein YndB with AHSA1/START domain
MARTDRASRVIDATPEAIFAAWTDADALVAWLPPDGMTATAEAFDLRPGGSYRMVLRYVDKSTVAGKSTADSDVVEARIVELVAGERLVQEVDFESDDPAFAGTMQMTWQVSAVDGGSVVEFIAADVPAGISAEDHAAGMASSLENLARFVAP